MDLSADSLALPLIQDDSQPNFLIILSDGEIIFKYDYSSNCYSFKLF